MVVLMKNIKILLVILIIFSCKENEKLDLKSIDINLRTFSFENNHLSNSNINVKIIKTDKSKLFVYKNFNDTLKIEKNKIFYLNNLLKKIDSKNVKLGDSIIRIDKYFLNNKIGKGYCMNIYLNYDIGLIFLESLDNGTFGEYDTNKYNLIHKLIALKKLEFKESPIISQYANMNYPELSMMDSIKEGKKWRYFIKKEN